MRNWVRRSLWTAACAGIAVAAVKPVAGVLQERKARRHVDTPLASVQVPNDAAAVERGHYLFDSRGCAHCHGADGGGRAFIDEPGGMYARSANISGARGSAVEHYRSADWVRAIRHGVKPDGTPVFIMPSDDYSRLTDEDTGALVAYLQQLPPVAGRPAEFRLPTIVKLLYAAGVVKDAAEKIDHGRAPPQPVAAEVSPAHGRYVASLCMGCHGEHLSGGRIPGAPPNWPPSANLTPGEGGVMGRYARADDFVAMLRSGKRPDGSAVSSVMPFDALRALNDIDARAVHAYLKQLPPLPAGGR
jgi:mono/diheme cytochrome c family protein